MFDIFDEVDAQLIPKKTFIYSIHGSTNLTEYNHRVNVPEQIIEALCIAMDLFH